MVSYLVSYLVKTSKVCAVHSVLLHYCKRKRPWRLYSFNNLCAYHLCYCRVDCLSFIYGNSLWSILLLSLYSSCQYQILQGHFLNQQSLLFFGQNIRIFKEHHPFLLGYVLFVYSIAMFLWVYNALQVVRCFLMKFYNFKIQVQSLVFHIAYTVYFHFFFQKIIQHYFTDL